MRQLFTVSRYILFSRDFAGEILICWAHTVHGITLYHMILKTADALKGLSK